MAALKLLAKKRRISKTLEIPCLLVAEGRPIEDIAADFSVTPLVVQRRLKRAEVSPRLMADYRADIVTLD